MINIDIPDRDNSSKSLFNPLSTDFVTHIRNDYNVNKEYVIPSMEIITYPTYLAERIEKDLITAIKNARNINPLIESETKKIKEEIELK
ncbi:MAG: hypothetical protein LAN71_17780 [Acidobacteriia bacterium]|nr:hypothetical protein [Terriglobia bacterium]